MQKITPFLWFDGQAEEAVNYYVSIFKNSRISSGPDPGKAGRVLKAMLPMKKIDLDALLWAAAG